MDLFTPTTLPSVGTVAMAYRCLQPVHAGVVELPEDAGYSLTLFRVGAILNQYWSS